MLWLKAAAFPTPIQISPRLAGWTSKAPWHPQFPGSPIVPLKLEGVSTSDVTVMCCFAYKITPLYKSKLFHFCWLICRQILLNFALCQLSAENCLDTWAAQKWELQGKGASPVTSGNSPDRLYSTKMTLQSSIKRRRESLSPCSPPPPTPSFRLTSWCVSL